MWTAIRENPDAAHFLLTHGANIEARDMMQNIPLMTAAFAHSPDLVQILLEHGAKVSPKDYQGMTALDMVRGDPDPDARKIEALLRRYGAK